LLAFGVLAVGCGVFLIATAQRHRTRRPGRHVLFAAGLGAFYVVLGALALTAFAVPATRTATVSSIASLLIARGVVFFVARRVSPGASP
jgi:uncharacterized membrane protein YgdD (TMEM256/DUF423 family)